MLKQPGKITKELHERKIFSHLWKLTMKEENLKGLQNIMKNSELPHMSTQKEFDG